MSSRQILKTSVTSCNDAADVMRMLFLSELMSPSREIWLVSPWISDISIFDNKTGDFSGLCPTWANRKIRLTEVVYRLLELGALVHIVTRPVEHNDNGFLRRLDELIRGGIVGENLKLLSKGREDLHIKGLLTECCILQGSMNITYNGIEVLDESISLKTGEDDVAQAYIQFRETYGSEMRQ